MCVTERVVLAVKTSTTSNGTADHAPEPRENGAAIKTISPDAVINLDQYELLFIYVLNIIV